MRQPATKTRIEQVLVTVANRLFGPLTDLTCWADPLPARARSGRIAALSLHEEEQFDAEEMDDLIEPDDTDLDEDIGSSLPGSDGWIEGDGGERGETSEGVLSIYG